MSPQRSFWSYRISPVICCMTRIRQFSCASMVFGKFAPATRIFINSRFWRSLIRSGLSYYSLVAAPPLLSGRNSMLRVSHCRLGQVAQKPGDHEGEESAGWPDLTLNSVISNRFLRLDPGSVERLGRYETALWRQVYQVIFVLDFLRGSGSRGRHPRLDVFVHYGRYSQKISRRGS